jgi:uncharacterized membrane-anchored protein YitT (DUF2179 family)
MKVKSVEKVNQYLNSEALFSKKWFRSYAYIVVGTFIMSLGYVYFINPYKIVPGGVYGISIMIHHLMGSPIGVTALFFNIPITLLGIKILGPKFGFKTVVGFVLSAIYIDVLNYFSKGVPLVQDDPLLSSIFGGALIGLGVGLFFKSKATAGGSDVVSMIIAKYSRLPLGLLMMIVDSSIVVVSLIAFRDWRIPLYSWIVIFITGKMIDFVYEGVSYDKMVYIISENNHKICDYIVGVLNRSATIIPATGYYTNNNKEMVYTVLNRRELTILLEKIREIDPMAFVSITNASLIVGKGFKSIHELNES